MPRKPDNWPFDQAPNVAAISEPAVIYDSVPILLVVHYSDDHSWAFLAGTDFRAANGKVIAMGEALRLDPTRSRILNPAGSRRVSASALIGPANTIPTFERLDAAA
jgi:hypothetical protein